MTLALVCTQSMLIYIFRIMDAAWVVRLVLFKGHLHTRSRYCINTLTTAKVVVVLSHMIPSVSFRILNTIKMCSIWYLALVRLCLITVRVIVLVNLLLFCRIPCFFFCTNISLGSMFPPDYFWFYLVQMLNNEYLLITLSYCPDAYSESLSV